MREHSMLQSFLRTGKRLGADEKEGKRAFQKAERLFTNFQKGWEDRINQLPTRQFFEIDIPTPLPPPPSPSPVKGGGELMQSPSFLDVKPVEDGCRGEKPLFRVAFVGHPYNLL